MCVRVVRRCTLDSAVVLSIVYREGGGTEIYSFTCDGRICLGLDNRTCRGPQALMVAKDEQQLNYLRTWLVGFHEDGPFTTVGLCQSRERCESVQACKFVKDATLGDSKRGWRWTKDKTRATP